FFAGLDMDAQIRKQIAFMSWAFGGPAQYKGRDLRQAHAKLVRQQALSDVHFEAVMTHLKTTLEELGVAPPLVAEAMSIVAGTRDEVLGRWRWLTATPCRSTAWSCSRAAASRNSPCRRSWPCRWPCACATCWAAACSSSRARPRSTA